MVISKVLFALLQSAVCGQPVTEDIKAACTVQMLEDVYTLANRHDLAHLAGQALSKLSLPESDGLAKCQQAAKQAIFRYMRTDLAYGQICGALEAAQIPFIPLKGSVLRAYYPEAWMRTSCDIDILVRENRLEAAVDALKSRLQFTEERKTDHDVSLFSPSGIHLELHYETVVESDAICDSNRVLSKVWDTANPVKPGSYHHQMSDGMFYFYHIAHMAKHFAVGGCGIRPFLDLWILRHRAEHDPAQYEQLLSEGGLTAFALAAEKLSEVWFSGIPADSMTDRFAQYVLAGGVYGTMENNMAVQQHKQGGKFCYALGKIFLPYKFLSIQYPVLQKQKWLMPCCQVARWFRLLFRGGVKRSVRQLKITASASREEIQSTQSLLEYLGLE